MNFFEEENVGWRLFLDEFKVLEFGYKVMIEIGLRFNFLIVWLINVVFICCLIGLERIDCIEKLVWYLIYVVLKDRIDMEGIMKDEENVFVVKFYDRMIECCYEKLLMSFRVNVKLERCYEVDLMVEGCMVLEKVNWDLGFVFDEWDLNYYIKLF